MTGGYRIRLLEDIEDIKQGEEMECSRSHADECVKNGLAEYVQQQAEQMQEPSPEVAIEEGQSRIATDAAKQKQRDMARRLLVDARDQQEIETYKRGINWLTGDYYSTWKRIKKKNDIQLKKRRAVDTIFFLAHAKDVIKGKPILVHE